MIVAKFENVMKFKKYGCQEFEKYSHQELIKEE